MLIALTEKIFSGINSFSDHGKKNQYHDLRETCFHENNGFDGVFEYIAKTKFVFPVRLILIIYYDKTCMMAKHY